MWSEGGGANPQCNIVFHLALKYPCALTHAYVTTYSNRVCMKYKNRYNPTFFKFI